MLSQGSFPALMILRACELRPSEAAGIPGEALKGGDEAQQSPGTRRCWGGQTHTDTDPFQQSSYLIWMLIAPQNSSLAPTWTPSAPTETACCSQSGSRDTTSTLPSPNTPFVTSAPPNPPLGRSLSPHDDVQNISPQLKQVKEKEKPKQRPLRRENPHTNSPCKTFSSTTCSAPATHHIQTVLDLS